MRVHVFPKFNQHRISLNFWLFVHLMGKSEQCNMVLTCIPYEWDCCHLVSKLCLTLLRPPWQDFSLPGSSVHGILQARILKWVAISFSRGSSRPRDWTWVSCSGRRILYCWATWEAYEWDYISFNTQFMFPSWWIIHQYALLIFTVFFSYLSKHALYFRDIRSFFNLGLCQFLSI